MQLKCYAIYDAKAEAYMAPFFLPSNGLATRAFQDMANDPNHPIGQHPEDYTLFEIGAFDDLNAQIVMLKANNPLGTALEYKKGPQEGAPLKKVN